MLVIVFPWEMVSSAYAWLRKRMPRMLMMFAPMAIVSIRSAFCCCVVCDARKMRSFGKGRMSVGRAACLATIPKVEVTVQKFKFPLPHETHISQLLGEI